ncbi:MAG: hypothetical protein R1F52_05880 [Candidatus Nitrosoabyssus spongiisocia]|nr:MAG: hypothetical protein R1F52_05880 [Nitrosopumilaceae archaeon AB1(1)]
MVFDDDESKSKSNLLKFIKKCVFALVVIVVTPTAVGLLTNQGNFSDIYVNTDISGPITNIYGAIAIYGSGAIGVVMGLKSLQYVFKSS